MNATPILETEDHCKSIVIYHRLWVVNVDLPVLLALSSWYRIRDLGLEYVIRAEPLLAEDGSSSAGLPSTAGPRNNVSLLGTETGASITGAVQTIIF